MSATDRAGAASPHPGDALSRGRRLAYLLILGGLAGLGPFTVDMYVPAFPALREEFGVPESVVQLTLTGTLIGFAVGQLVMGPLSDVLGRRWPLIASTVLHIAASLVVATAADIWVLGGARFLQGVGAAAGGVVTMAIVRDLFGGRPLVRMLSRLALVMGLAPIVAPVLGAQLLAVIDWRGIFVVLAAYSALLVVLVLLGIRETLPPRERGANGHSTARQRYRAVLTDRVFLGVAIIGGMNFAGLFTYLSASPFLFQEGYGMDVQTFGWMFAIGAVGVTIGTQVSSRLIQRLGAQWVLVGTTAVHVAMAAVLAALAAADAPVWAIIVPIFVFLVASGFTFPAVQVLGLANHPREAGTAASILGAANFGLAGAISPLVGVIGIGSALPMALVMVATALTATLVVWAVVRPRSVPALAA